MPDQSLEVRIATLESFVHKITEYCNDTWLVNEALELLEGRNIVCPVCSVQRRG